jgi:carbonic anhydrase
MIGKKWQQIVHLSLLGILLAACASTPPAPVEPIVVEPPVVSAPMDKAKQSQLTPDAAIALLKEGNERFLAGNMLKRDLLAQEKASGLNGQFPIASVVSCIDSRSDPALIFDQGLGDIFTARVAGNIVNPDILGSLEYASKVAGAKAIIVLGHTHCGAIKGACDKVAMGNLTQLITKLSPAVKASPNVGGPDRSSKNHEFVDTVAEMNVEMTVKAITAKSPILKEMVNKGQIKIIGAMLNVETGEVHFSEH